MSPDAGKTFGKKKLKQLTLQKASPLKQRISLIWLILFIPCLSIAQHLETVIQQGHELAVVTVAISPDSNHVATGSKDKSIKLWERNTGREVRSYLGHLATVTSIAFTPDGEYLVSGSNDKSIRIWKVSDGRQVGLIQTKDIITDIVVDPAGRFFVVGGYGNSGYGDSTAIYDFKSRKVIRKIPAYADRGMGSGIDLSISRDGKFIASGEDNHEAIIYETSGWKAVGKVVFTEGSCGGCGTRTEFSRDNKYIYLVSNNGALTKYEIQSLKKVKTYSKSDEDLNGFAISWDGSMIARTTEKDLVIWNERTGDSIMIASPEKAEFHEIAFSLDNKEVLVSSDNNTLMRFDIRKKAFGHNEFTGFLNQRDRGGLDYDPNFYWESAIARYIRFKNNVMITHDGKSLIKGKFGSKVKRWDLASGKTIMDYVGHKKAVLCYELSKDGRKMLTGGGDGKIMVWDVDSGDSLQVIKSYRHPIFDIHFNADETKVISCSWDGTMRMHDLATGEMLVYQEFEKGSAYSILLSAGDLYYFSARLDNSLQMWEADTKKEVRNFTGHTDIIASIRLSSDEKQLLSASWDGSARLWDVGTGLMSRKFKASQGAMHIAIFSPDGKFVYGAGADRLIHVWDITSGAEVKKLEGHRGEITSLLFSPDNKMLVSHSVDGVTKIWDVNSGKEFFEHIQIGERDWMAKSPDGYFNATDDARRYIHFTSGMKTFSVDQFFNEYFRPDLLPRLFQTRGGGSESRSIQGKLNSSSPPAVKIAAIPHGGGKADVFVRLTNTGSGVMNVKLFHNGKSVAVDPAQLKMPSSGQTLTIKHAVELVGGNNVFSATATNKENIESDAQSVELFSEHATKSSTCYVVTVGINSYKNSKLSLNYARPDAESFADLMKGKTSELFKDIHFISLYDQQATRQGILTALDELAGKLNQEDVFIFYYAGHGSIVDNRFYFIPTESSRLYDQGSLNKEAIEASLLQEKFKHIRALKQLIIMDACQSGGSVELLATRGAGEEKAIAQLSRSAGIHVMASAGSEQFATEFASLGHGLFTSVLIRGLQGEADGAPKDGKVTIYELKSFIDDQVPEMTRKLKGNPQYPYTFSRGQDFPVVIQE